jgi:choline kinase
MDALIMAAGRGSRLGPETDGRPKSLVDLGGISPIELQLDLLAARGIERAIVVTGYRREAIEAAVVARTMNRMKAVFVWNPFWTATNVLGSAWMASDQLSSAFVYLHADTVFEPTILDDLLAADGDVLLPVDLRPCEPEQMKAKVEGGLVTRLSKELNDDETAGEFIGIGVFRENVIRFIREGMDAVLAAGGISAYFEESLNWAITNRGLAVRPVATAGRSWAEIDFPEDLQTARGMLPDLLR